MTALIFLLFFIGLPAGFYFLFAKTHPMYHEGSLTSGEISVYVFELRRFTGGSYKEYRFNIFGDKITYVPNPAPIIIFAVIMVVALIYCLVSGIPFLYTMIFILAITSLAGIMFAIKIFICKQYIRKNVF
ncbi:MAG: hypothetical protein K6C99_10030 [Lachnospiraceae bacterium]|nr:hypothetical protein [Lachnospiraceae bacterium]